MCREKYYVIQNLRPERGSPLHVQGNDRICTLKNLQSRITPACAGKSLQLFPKSQQTEDHPCVCREKFVPEGSSLNGTGSPLRVQGKEVSYDYEVDIPRITPACAGKSISDIIVIDNK